MILGSDRKREIGHMYRGVQDDGVSHPDQPFVVLREATAQEWLEEGLRRLGRMPETDNDLDRSWFYEVSMD